MAICGTRAWTGCAWAFLIVGLLSPWEGTAAIVGDSFAAPVEISGGRGVITLYTAGATREANEPWISGRNNGGASVWLRWTAPTNGTFIFDTEGSEFDTLLGVYTGTNLANLSLLASNDDIENRDNLQSRVTITAAANVIYRIAIDGDAGAAGYAVLNWRPAPLACTARPLNDNLAQAEALAGFQGTAHGATVCATREELEPWHANVPCGNSIWFRWEAPASGLACFDTLGSDFDTVLGIYQGSSMEALTVVAGNNDAGNLERLSRVVFRASQGTVYAIALGGVTMLSGVTREGTSVLHWRLDPDGGRNDLFAQAQVIEGPHGLVYGLTVGATREPGEPVRTDNPGGASVWYRWKAPADGTVVFDTSGSLFDAAIYRDVLMTLYRGDTLAGLVLVADNYVAATGGYSSQITAHVTAGSQYYLSVDGYYDAIFCRCVAAGMVVLSWTQPEVVLMTEPSREGHEAFATSLRGPPGRECVIESSPDLVQWQALLTVPLGFEPTRVVLESNAAAAEARFYRAVLVP